MGFTISFPVKNMLINGKYFFLFRKEHARRMKCIIFFSVKNIQIKGIYCFLFRKEHTDIKFQERYMPGKGGRVIAFYVGDVNFIVCV